MKPGYISAIPHIFSRYLSFFFLITGLTVTAQDEELIENEDLSLRFITIDRDGNVSSASSFSRLETIGFFILREDEFDLIRLCNDDPFNIWINGQLFFPNETCKDIARDELLTLSRSDSAYIVLNTKGDFGGIRAQSFKRNFDRTVIYFPLKERTQQVTNDVLITMLLVVVIFFGLVKYYSPAVHRSLFDLSLRPTGATDKTTEIDQKIVITTLALSLVAAICFWYIQDHSTVSAGETFSGEILQILLYVAVAYVILIFKYLFIGMIARLNSLRELPYLQYYDFLKFFTLVSLALLALLTAKFWLEFLDPSADNWFWRNIYLLAYGAFLLYYFYKLGLGFKYKKLRIISYLCTTEILGVLLIALIFTK